MIRLNNLQHAVNNKLHAHTDQQETHQTGDSLNPPLPTQRIIAPELRNDPQTIMAISAKMIGGATVITQCGNVDPSRTVEAELMIIAIVPGPAVLGMANGTNAMLALGSLSSSSDLLWLPGIRALYAPGTASGNQ